MVGVYIYVIHNSERQDEAYRVITKRDTVQGGIDVVVIKVCKEVFIIHDGSPRVKNAEAVFLIARVVSIHTTVTRNMCTVGSTIQSIYLVSY